MEGENIVSKSDAAKEVMIYIKRMNLVCFLLIVSPIMTLFVRGNLWIGGLVAIGSAMIGGWFVQNNIKRMRYLRTKYNLP